jgi:hypothetical protein
MTDGKQAFLDAKLFLRKLKRHLTKQNLLSSGQKSFKYITIVEPQGENHGNSCMICLAVIRSEFDFPTVRTGDVNQ